MSDECVSAPSSMESIGTDLEPVIITVNLKRKLSCRSLKEKYQALQEFENGVPNKELAAKYSVPRSTISTWIKNKRKIVEAFEGGHKSPMAQRLRRSRHEVLDRALYKWYIEVKSNGSRINGPMVIEKAKSYAKEFDMENFKGSYGWLDRWKNRYSIKFDRTVATNVKSCGKPWEESTASTIISKYSLKDIYIVVEFGLFYKALPNEFVPLKSAQTQQQARLTCLTAANPQGDKLPLFVIGKSSQPKCFSTVNNLPCRYRPQRKCLLNCKLFVEWVWELEKKFEQENRRVVLIVDNCLAIHEIKHLKFITLISLSADAPTMVCPKVQPMSEGVIRLIKAYYRLDIVRRYIRSIKESAVPNITILDAMSNLVAAWEGVTLEPIRNCFRKAGLLEEVPTQDDNWLFISMADEIKNLKQIDPGIQEEEMTVDDIINVDRNLPTTDSILANVDISLDDFQTETTAEDDGGENDEPPKQPTKDELRNAVSVIMSHCLFVKGKADELRKSTIHLSQLIEKSFENLEQ